MSGDGATFRTTTCEVAVDEDGTTVRSSPTMYAKGKVSEWSGATPGERIEMLASPLLDGRLVVLHCWSWDTCGGRCSRTPPDR